MADTGAIQIVIIIIMSFVFRVVTSTDDDGFDIFNF